MNTSVLVLIIVLIIVVIALGVVGLALYKRKRSERLQQHFGTEYDRSVAGAGDQKAAEAELLERERRRAKLDIRPLRDGERDQYQQYWDSIQSGFIDDPSRALEGADRLVIDVMRRRGYPVDDFDRRAEDISVDHPEVVRHYREAHSVRAESLAGSTQDETDDGRPGEAGREPAVGGPSDTERQRQALTAYRSLVDVLLGHDHSESKASSATSSTRSDSPRTEQPT